MEVENISWMTRSRISGFLRQSSRQRDQVERQAAPPADFLAFQLVPPLCRGRVPSACSIVNKREDRQTVLIMAQRCQPGLSGYGFVAPRMPCIGPRYTDARGVPGSRAHRAPIT